MNYLFKLVFLPPPSSVAGRVPVGDGLFLRVFVPDIPFSVATLFLCFVLCILFFAALFFLCFVFCIVYCILFFLLRVVVCNLRFSFVLSLPCFLLYIFFW